MNLRLRFTLIILALFAAMAAAVYGIAVWQQANRQEIAEGEKQERQVLLRELLKLETEAGRHFADDYSQWNEMVDYVAKPTPEWATVNIDDSLEDFHVTCAWVFRNDSSLLYSACWPDPARMLEPPLPMPDLRQLFQLPTFDFFQIRDGKLYEVHGAAIVPSDDADRVKPRSGYLVIAKLWDDAKLRTMEPITQGRLEVLPAGTAYSLAMSEAMIPLFGPTGQPAAWLKLNFEAPELAELESRDSIEIIAFSVIGAAALFAFWWSIRAWVLRPLSLIGESIANDDDSALAPLQRANDEIGRLAQLVGESQDQRLLLREALDERVRLGRDLHDGAIQKIYSFGMNTASARGLLHSDPKAADAMLGHSLGVANEVIGELRTFIHRLEPEPAASRRMSEVFRKLLEPAAGKLRTEVAIDDSLADRLEPRPRSHLMFFASEAISNALRHAQAKSLRVSLQAEGGGARLEVVDDGAGFDPSKVPADRQGQRNLAARARELGATLQIQSAPGKGTAIILHLPAESLLAARKSGQ